MDGWEADEKEIFSDGETSELFIRTSVFFSIYPLNFQLTELKYSNRDRIG